MILPLYTSRNGVVKTDLTVTEKTSEAIQKNPSVIKQLVALKALKQKPRGNKNVKPSVIKK